MPQNSHGTNRQSVSNRLNLKNRNRQEVELSRDDCFATRYLSCCLCFLVEKITVRSFVHQLLNYLNVPITSRNH